jgi:DNA ligase (NAD+)
VSKIKELAYKIVKARHDYYNVGPTVSDAIFDAWVDELSKLDPNHTAVTSVGAPVVSEWKKAKHYVPMGSLNKVNTEDEFRAWAKYCEQQSHSGTGPNSRNLNSRFFFTEKLDGVSINTIWEKGKLVQALTRGNGDVGEDITVNVARMKGVPKNLTEPFSGSVRGEIILLKSDNKKYFPEYTSPRNAASGIAKRLDGVGTEHLTVMMYTVNGKDFDTENQQFNWLAKVGFNIAAFSVYYYIQDAISQYKKYQSSLRDALDYDIDGIVIRIDNMSSQFALGEKNNRPVAQIAFKFEAPSATSKIIRFVDQVGNTGTITPVAEFDEVNLLGAKIKRASCYNYSYIKELGIDVGSEVLIIRANDVIPRVEELIKGTGSVHKPPKKCPECNSPTEFNGEYLRCTNKETCPAQVIGRLKTWVNEQNILEWGESILQKTIDAGLVKDVGDLYRLTAEQLEKLDRMGERSAQKLVDVLNEHRNISLENLIGGLGINGVGTSTTKVVVEAGYDTLDAMLVLTQDRLASLGGFGSIRAKALVNGLKTNKKRIEDILAAGVTIKPRVKGKLTGKSFCFTGSMEKPRPALQKMVEDAGGSVKKSVGKGLHYLVIADTNSASSKAEAAKKLGTTLISEQQFLDMI